MFCWPYILVQLWVNDQLDSHLRCITRLLLLLLLLLLSSSTCFEQLCANHQEVKFFNTTSGIVFLLTENIISDVVLIQFDLLMMGTELLETCRGL